MSRIKTKQRRRRTSRRISRRNSRRDRTRTRRNRPRRTSRRNRTRRTSRRTSRRRRGRKVILGGSNDPWWQGEFGFDRKKIMGHTGMNPEAVDELIEKRKDEMKKEGDAEDAEVEDLEEGPQTTTPNYTKMIAQIASAPINIRKLVDRQKRKDDREQRRKDDLDLLKRAGFRRLGPGPRTDASRIRELETFLSFRPEGLNEEETKGLVYRYKSI